VILDKKIVQNIFVTDDYLYAITTNYLLKIDKNNKLVSSYKFSDQGLGLYDEPYLNSKYYAYPTADRRGILVGLIDKPWIKKVIKFSNYDTTQWILGTYLYNFIAINDHGTLMVLVGWYSRKTWRNVPGLMIFNLDPGTDSFRVSFDHVVSSPDILNSYIIELISSGNDFYASSSSNNSTFKITQAGVDQYFMPFDHCFCLNHADTTSFLGFNERRILGIYSNTNSWSQRMTFDLGLYDGFMFNEVGNRILASYQYQMWLFTPDYKQGTMQIKELDTGGMEPSEIRSAVLFNGKVYLATFRGLYYKSINHLLKYK
jgi:hypothetical protein